MNRLVYDINFKSWKKISKRRAPEPLNQDLEFYKKKLGDFHFYVIFNVAEATIEFCEKGIVKVLGYRPRQFSFEQLLEIIHPEDLPVFLDYEAEIADFFESLQPDKVFRYKARYDYRIRTLRGAYKRLMKQVVALETDQSGAVIRTLAVYSDIGFLKKNTMMTLSLFGMDDEPSYPNFKSTRIRPLLRNPFTKRETKVLQLLGNGKSSRDIGKLLLLSKHTVNNHRKNMLRKAGVKTSTGLLGKALANSWL